MPEVKIERLVLQACGMDAEAAKRLAQAVAAGIERGRLAADLPQRREIDEVEVRAHELGKRGLGVFPGVAAEQFGVDQFRLQRHPGGKAVYQRHQGLAVRFTGGQIT